MVRLPIFQHCYYIYYFYLSTDCSYLLHFLSSSEKLLLSFTIISAMLICINTYETDFFSYLIQMVNPTLNSKAVTVSILCNTSESRYYIDLAADCYDYIQMQKSSKILQLTFY